MTRHSPNYIHPYPFTLPSGQELWLCPATFHQANTLLKLYTSLDGPPARHAHIKFNYFVRSLLTYYWNMVLEIREHDAQYEVVQPVEDEDTRYLDIYEIIKKTPAYE